MVKYSTQRRNVAGFSLASERKLIAPPAFHPYVRGVVVAAAVSCDVNDLAAATEGRSLVELFILYSWKVVLRTKP